MINIRLNLNPVYIGLKSYISKKKRGNSFLPALVSVLGSGILTSPEPAYSVSDFAAKTILYTNPAKIAPAIGATQNSQS